MVILSQPLWPPCWPRAAPHQTEPLSAWSFTFTNSQMVHGQLKLSFNSVFEMSRKKQKNKGLIKMGIAKTKSLQFLFQVGFDYHDHPKNVCLDYPTQLPGFHWVPIHE